MKKKVPSESENSDKSVSSEENDAPDNGGATEYEKQRMRRIQENKARMEALGLCKMASRVEIICRRDRKGKGKVKSEEDDDYEPDENDDNGDEELSSSSQEFDEYEQVKNGGKSKSRSGRVKKKPRPKKVSSQNIDNPDFMDEDKALMQAIALSLEDSKDVSNAGPSCNSNSQAVNSTARKGHDHLQGDAERRKRRKSASTRVQMTEDDVLIHFCQFDEVGKGSIKLRDLQRMAAAHDFTWTDKELADMIRCFDSDHDGKLSLGDFRSIVSRCGMLRVLDDGRWPK
ncbi:hypothetical protein Nepgr_023506 [Nepenthes gracilis]|uniref:EF-hand domain-containing protein n=1 Tax=Nepenthes gracilis TaxID=150966 RepID=A0AAD3T376_NEPGR|nr:hypothetical protein Nepgr_023506 [Nepenthes gracilis]